ncbi:MAG: OmpA family protein [Actinobacteria bacterium]|nr:OmpA family protein [Actinomycetota bacterium]
MTNPTADRLRRSRRTILACGVLALVGVFVLGAFVQVPAMEDDLTRAAERALSAAQLEASVRFDGQSATLACARDVDGPAARDVVAAVHGVRTVRLGEGCSVATAPATTEGPPVDSISSDGGTSPSSTVPDTTGTTESSVSTTTPPVTTPEPGVVTVTFQKGSLVLMGLVATPDQHAALLTAAASVASAENITDGVRDDATVTIADADVDTLVDLLTAMTVPLASAEIGWRPDGVYARGVVADEAAGATFEALARDLGVTPLLVVRQTATDESAAATRDELNAIVAATPIEFGKGQITVSPTSMYIIERLAGVAKSYGGVIVQVQGHTDSEGDAGRNQTLSDQRAEAVRAELVRLGVPAADITSVGFGESQLITDPNGNELADQSRRVVFDVTTTG